MTRPPPKTEVGGFAALYFKRGPFSCSGLGPVPAQTPGSGHRPVSALNPAQARHRPVTEPVTVLTRDVKFEPSPRVTRRAGRRARAGLLPGLNASCWAHAGLSRSSLMLKGYTAGLNARHRGECRD